MSIKLNTARSAAVNQANGVAVLGTYSEKHRRTHWQGLPTFATGEAA